MRAVADVTRGIVRAQVDIGAPPELVFEALTEPAQLAAWWGGELYRTENWEMELRPGARWRCDARSERGDSEVGGEILEVDPPHRLVLTWRASWDAFERTVITYTLAATATGTRVTVVHTGFEGRPASCEDHAQGWHLVLGWMAAFAEARASAR